MRKETKPHHCYKQTIKYKNILHFGTIARKTSHAHSKMYAMWVWQYSNMAIM